MAGTAASKVAGVDFHRDGNVLSAFMKLVKAYQLKGGP